MPASPLVYSSGVAAVQAITGSTEVVVATVSGIATRYAGQTIKLTGHAVVTTGTTTTAVVCQIRRTSLTGTLVSDATGQAVIAAAGSSNTYYVFGTDSPGDVTGYTYVLTVTDTGGGTGGATVYAVLEARVD